MWRPRTSAGARGAPPSGPVCHCSEAQTHHELKKRPAPLALAKARGAGRGGCQVTARTLPAPSSLGKGLVLSPQQATALDEIDHWFRHSDDPLFELAGLAGVGKT